MDKFKVFGGIVIAGALLIGGTMAFSIDDAKEIRVITDKMAVVAEDITISNIKKIDLQDDIKILQEKLSLVENHIVEQNKTMETYRTQINAIINPDNKSFQ